MCMCARIYYTVSQFSLIDDILFDFFFLKYSDTFNKKEKQQNIFYHIPT